ncbi:2TM domain-containing protein [Flagellimonas allohymeniacidonis]|uniref:2TM domain-containing protein n=1 Tax=Flagellimonas allohymeniacidonis TaxID=2517819 RepID=A0A4Q8QKB6_9FLAO|nr:2TM domain-containing protein [Allomuricauda hymeniacidonis]TAI49223.1 2TM domain-containing protein [Allomuricauda hymeniacidonis]
MEQLDKENKYIKAKERVTQLKKFYANLTTYVLVISALALINYLTNGFRYMWFLWAALGWGIGVAFHAIGTFNLNPFFGKGWEQRKIKQYMEEEEKTKKWR